ncbi:MAG: valine--tRNA ligase, partial [Candidatus Nanopelagicales bacterium]
VWSWWQEGSVHRQPWPDAAGIEVLAGGADAALVDDVSTVLSLVRKAKSEAKASMRAPIDSAVVTAPADQAARLRTASGDLAATGSIAGLGIVDGTGPMDVRVVLAGQPA